MNVGNRREGSGTVKLVIVESPAKAKTIERFLGPDYRVVASYGHVRDLPRSARDIPAKYRDKPWARYGVDTEDSYRPIYIVPAESREHIAALRSAIRGADELLLATDEDREGEAISWHVAEVLRPKVPVRRIAFHEITKAAIEEALANPRPVNDRLVRAQEARRVLDRLFGFELSPVLWRKVRAGLSAGRVQSVALRLVVEREEERLRFRSSEYWRAIATLAANESEFEAALVRVGGRRVAEARDFDPSTGALSGKSNALVIGAQAAKSIAAHAPASLPWRVSRVEDKSVRQRPRPPFTTSTLQQAASGRLRMSPGVTMRVAQTLYDGIDLGGGDREGIITYMRTDSVTLSEKALSDVGAHIRSVYGSDARGRSYYSGPRRYRTKSKLAQEAHEAIRPTAVSRTPESLRSRLGEREFKLYDLIWRRTVASQMADAEVDRTTVHLTAAIGEPGAENEHVFRANGSVLRFPGYLKVWSEKRKDQLLPPMEEGDLIRAADHAAAGRVDGVKLLKVEPERRDTRPPARHTEASLVRKLEEEGIGRPSTYASTLSTLQDRDYVRKVSGLVPTYVGIAVNQLLREHFGKYVDVGFTAIMENRLDEIAIGQGEYRRFLDSFYRGSGNGGGLADEVREKLPEIEYPEIEIGTCATKRRPVRVRIGRRTPFLQRGQPEDGDRAQIPDDLFIEDLTIDRACELLDSGDDQGPIELGRCSDTALAVYLKSGPYGHYVQLGEDQSKGKGKPRPRRTSVPKDMDPADLTLEYALELLSLPRVLGKDPKTGGEVRANDGRYGPYVQLAKEYRSLRSLDQALTITLDEALALLAQPKQRRTRTRKVLKSLGPHPDTGAEVEVLEGRYGPYVTDGKVNGRIPKDRAPESVTLDEAVRLLAEGAERRKLGRGRARRRRGASRR
ncbi:MAG: type I DNA topoisomerase [Gemmatimonadetes bacterium]|nr:type I DNA topoisomerase [Gemmatimonadota bacterium]